MNFHPAYTKTGSPPSLLKIEKETFRRPFRRGQETRAERSKRTGRSDHPTDKIIIRPQPLREFQQ